MKENTIQQTLLYPIIGRAKVTKDYPHILEDKTSYKIIEKFDPDMIAKLDQGKFPALVYCGRYLGNIKLAKDYLKDHPEASVVNLGCGLDSLYEAIDNGKMKYYNLDFPEVIDLRKDHFPLRQREYNIACSMTDHSWMDQVDFDKSKGILFLSAGVLYYFTLDQARDLIAEMASRFPGGRFAFDNESPAMIKKSNKSVKNSGISNAQMHFILKDPMYIKTWSPHISKLSLILDLFFAMENTKGLPLVFKMGRSMLKRKPNMYYIVMDFDMGPRKLA